jgi:putative phage-type endonuclease
VTRLFEVVNVEQGSEEWFQVRAGRVTGGEAAAVMAGKDTATRKDYRLKLAVERMTGKPEIDDYSNRYMRHGQETEPMARLAVEMRMKVLVRETGFLRHTSLLIGASLDGDIDDFAKTIEIKCPKPTTHVDYLQAGRLPAVYRWQVVHGLLVSGAQSCIFASYCPGLPDGLQLFCIEVHAKDLPLEEYETALKAFLKEVDDTHEQLLRLRKKHE